MASNYLQKYPVPQDFPTILKNFTREILRDQPSNVIQYSAKYFEALEKGQPFTYKSAFNVPKAEKTYELSYDARKAEQIIKKDSRINRLSGSLSQKQTHKISQVVDLIFQRYDKDRSGYLDGRELRVMIKELYKQGQIDAAPAEAEIINFVSKIDANHNYKVDKSELFTFVRNFL